MILRIKNKSVKLCILGKYTNFYRCFLRAGLPKRRAGDRREPACGRQAAKGLQLRAKALAFRLQTVGRLVRWRLNATLLPEMLPFDGAGESIRFGSPSLVRFLARQEMNKMNINLSSLAGTLNNDFRPAHACGVYLGMHEV